MNKITIVARQLFAIAIAAFAIQHFIYGHFGLEPFPGWLPLQAILSYLIGVFLIGVALCITLQKNDRQAALFLGLFYLVNTILLHLPRVIAALHDGNEWTGCFEALGISSSALVLAYILRGKRTLASRSATSPTASAATSPTASAAASPTASRTVSANGWPPFIDTIVRSAPFLFAICLVVYAMLHFNYADYIATLIPSWIPARLFLSWFIGFAFLASAVGIAIKKKGRLAAMLMGLMFTTWFLILHLPRVIASPKNEAEWTSAFVALALGSGFWMLSSVLPD